MAAFSAAFDPALLMVADARAVLRDATVIEHIAGTVIALCAARVAGGDPRPGARRLAAEQLADLTGTSLGAANDAIAVGLRLLEQPEVAAAARAGELSAPQLAAIADGVAANPDADRRLLDKAASSSLADLRNESARVKAAAQPDPDRRRAEIRAGRSFRHWTDGAGVGHIGASGNVEDIAQIVAAVSSTANGIFHAARQLGQREPSTAYEFDALVQLAVDSMSPGDKAEPPTMASAGADVSIASGSAPDGSAPDGSARDVSAPDGSARSGSARDVSARDGSAPDGSARDVSARDGSRASRGDPDGSGPRATAADGSASSALSSSARGAARVSRDVNAAHANPSRDKFVGGPAGGNPKRQRERRGAQVKLLVRVDLDTFLRGYPLDGEVCELDGCGPIPMAAVHDLMAQGDPLVAAIVTRGQTVIGVAHLRRRANAHQKTALEWLYPSCSVKGCNQRGHLETDHRVDWAKTHYTVLDLLDSLCKFHHGKKTRDNWALVEGTGKRDFVPPEDPRHPGHRLRAQSPR